MPLITRLLLSLKSDFPQFRFELSDDFLWSYRDNIIYYTKNNDQVEYLFHELAHGLLSHSSYQTDVELIAMERQAWEKACEIAKSYNILITDDFVQSNLDSYRDWLHARSKCPECKATGMQTDKITYKCPECAQAWQVNDAKNRNLKRYKV